MGGRVVDCGAGRCAACTRWERAFDSVPDAIMILDAAYGIEWANERMASMIGVAPEALVGRRCYDVLHGTTAPVEDCPHAQMMRDGQEHLADTFEPRVNAHLRISVSPLRDEAGRLTGAVHVARDVTELRQVADALRQSEEMARALVRLHELSAFLSLAEVLDYALQELVRLTGSEVGYLYRYDEERQFLELVGWSGKSPDEGRGGGVPRGCSLAETGLWGAAVRERRVVVTNEPGASALDTSGGPRGLARQMNGPVVVGDRIVAVAGVGNKRAPYLASDELLLANLMGGVWQVVVRKEHEEEILGYQRSLRWLHRRLAATEEEERRRLAAEIHDTISQDLAAIRLGLAQFCMEERDAQRAAGAQVILSALEGTIRTSRALSYKLSSPFLEQFGLAAALQWLAEDTGRRHEIAVECACDELAPEFPREATVLLHRIAQELLQNVVKHSRASRAAVRLARDGAGARLEVEDWGCGFSAPAPRSGAREHGGFGLFSVRERLRDIGGSIRIHTAPGEGTLVVLSVPGARAQGGTGA